MTEETTTKFADISCESCEKNAQTIFELNHELAELKNRPDLQLWINKCEENVPGSASLANQICQRARERTRDYFVWDKSDDLSLGKCRSTNQKFLKKLHLAGLVKVAGVRCGQTRVYFPDEIIGISEPERFDAGAALKEAVELAQQKKQDESSVPQQEGAYRGL